MCNNDWDTPGYRKLLPQIGKKYHALTVLDVCKERNQYKQIMLLCKCSICEGVEPIRASKLIAGKIQSCGCLRKRDPKKFIGKTFNELTILGEAPKKGTKVMVDCICSCGKHKAISLSEVILGGTRSCGHLKATDHPEQYVGKKYGMLKVLEVRGIINHVMVVRCLCDCGHMKDCRLGRVLAGTVSSCGCKGKIMDPEKYIGDVFGLLEVMKIVPDPKGMGRATALCGCVCGKEYTVKMSLLLNGEVVSCGCKKLTKGGITALCGGKPYGVWRSMMKRCYVSGSYKTRDAGLKFLTNAVPDKGYSNYGGRGISVCKEWHDPEVFVKWYVGAIKDGESMDRVDNDGNYEPGNMRSATALMQAHNQRQRKDTSGTTGYTGIYHNRSTYRWEVTYDNSTESRKGFKSLLEALVDRNLYIIENNLPNRLNMPKDKCELTLVVDPEDPMEWELCVTDHTGARHMSKPRRLGKNMDKSVLNSLVASLRQSV